jgi:hypothetical protein
VRRQEGPRGGELPRRGSREASRAQVSDPRGSDEGQRMGGQRHGREDRLEGRREQDRRSGPEGHDGDQVAASRVEHAHREGRQHGRARVGTFAHRRGPEPEQPRYDPCHHHGAKGCQGETREARDGEQHQQSSAHVAREHDLSVGTQQGVHQKSRHGQD